MDIDYDEMLGMLNDMEEMLTDFEENPEEKDTLEQFVKTCGPMFLDIKLMDNPDLEKVCTQAKNIGAITMKSDQVELNQMSAGVLLSCIDLVSEFLTRSRDNKNIEEISFDSLNKRIVWLEEKYKKLLGVDDDLANKELFTTKELQNLLS